MPESAEELYARIAGAVGEDGRLPMPPYQDWDSFPWEIVDGKLVPKVLGPPVAAEGPRGGESAERPCPTCAEERSDAWIWENERWFVRLMPEPGGLPLILFLQTKEHLDYPDMDDELAGEYGRLSTRLCRIMSHLLNVGRVHVCRWGDGNQHLHVWFIARPERFPQIIGSMAVEWDEMLPPPPDDVRRADARAVAERLASHDGRSLV
jgi:diadenosine tetraphosphate (Ap4A) HIT family hydrolase